jgi:hypothetical protein
VGALTPDRNEYSDFGYAWPAACAPAPHAALKAKFAATFGDGGGGGNNAPLPPIAITPDS